MGQHILGIIGGSGLYELPGIRDVETLRVDTPFGPPSDEIARGRLGDAQVVFVPRHGRGHGIMPTEINYRANVFAMKRLGVEWLVSVGAVGSLREPMEPGHVVIPDQFIDRTVARPSTFFGRGVVAHVSMADPVCAQLSGIVAEAVADAGGTVHRGGTYLCMEGPQFSTRADSHLYRQWGADIIGMTNWQEAKLAREAEMCFASMALVTDYDCWHPVADHVVIEDVLRLVASNAELARRALSETVERLPAERQCGCDRALENAIITDRARIPADVRAELGPLIGKYVGETR
jgi:5'-methylthioadenosine phosphorylase